MSNPETWVLCRPAGGVSAPGRGRLEYLTGGSDVWVASLEDVTLCWDTAAEAGGYARAMRLPAGSYAPMLVPPFVRAMRGAARLRQSYGGA